ncbi:MAG: hypothetical protein JNN22_04595 [Rhodospirillales bacterium]|nr:hypothetical protein [Rhodospirillales bacterium]
MRPTRIFLTSVLACVALVSGSAAQSLDGGPRHAPGAGRFAVMPHFGTELDLGGNFTESARANVPAVSIFGKLSFDTSGNITVAARTFGDLYSMPAELGFDMAYGVSDLGEVFGGFRYIRATGRRAVIGAVNATGTVVGTGNGFSPGAALSAQMENFGSVAGEVGYRQFLIGSGSLLPYVAGSLGATRTSTVGSELFVRNDLGADESIGRVALFQRSYAFTGGMQVGATYALAPQAALGVEVGARYVGAMRGNDTDLRGGDNGLFTVNDSGGRWTLPIRLTGRIVF